MLAENHDFPPFSKQEYSRRFEMIRSAMEERGLDCLVIYGGDHCHGNDRGASNAVYVANYVCVPAAYVVVPLRGDPTLIVRFSLHLKNARDIASVEDVRAGGRFIEQGVGERLKELNFKYQKVGLVGSGVIVPNYTLPLEHHQYLAATFPQLGFENVNAWFADLRSIKSEEEIRFMERAGELVSHAYREMILSTHRGARHVDIRTNVECLGIRLGATYPLLHLDSTPMDKPDMSYPAPVPTTRTVEDGHVVMTELAMGLGSYSAKILGTYFVGQPNAKYREMTELAGLVYEQTVSGLKPGMRGRDVKRFLEPIEKSGYVAQGTLIMGWANYIERPNVGAMQGTFGASVESPADLDFEFKPGHCIYAVGRVATPDLQSGVWIGASCVFTQDRLKKLVSFPVSELTVI